MSFQKPTAGQSLQTTPIASATFQSHLVDVVDDFNRHKMGASTPKQTPPIKSNEIRIANGSAADRRKGEVLKIGTFSLSDVDRRTLWFNGTVPTDSTDTVAVLLEPIKYADTGYFQAQVTGVVPALVDIQTEGDAWAVIDPDSPVLISATSSGMFPILHAPSGTGEKECVILMDRSTATIGVKFRNDSGYEIPPYAVMEITDSEYKPDVDGYYSVIRPTTKRTSWGWLINNSALPVAIAATSSNGAFSYDGNTFVLVRIKTPSYDYIDPYRDSSSYAPKPGYWHLERGANVTLDGLSTNIGEDYGFQRVIQDHVLLSDYDYDYGDGEGEVNPIAKKFMQMPEPVELSQLFPLRTTFYADVAGTPTAHASAITNTGRYCLRAKQTANSYHDRIGIDIISGDTASLTPIRFSRTGVYKVEVKLHLTSTGNNYADAGSFSDETVTGGGGGTYKKPTGTFLYPREIKLDVTGYHIGDGVLTMDGVILLQPSYWVTVYKNMFTSNGTVFYTIYAQFQVQAHLRNAEHGTTSEYPSLGILLSTYGPAANNTLAIVDGSDSVTGSEYSWLKVTRLRMHPQIVS